MEQVWRYSMFKQNLFASNSLSNYWNTILTELKSELPPEDKKKSSIKHEKEEIEPLLDNGLDTVECIKEDPSSLTFDPSSVNIDPSFVTFDPSSVNFAPSSDNTNKDSIDKGIVGTFANHVFHIFVLIWLIYYINKKFQYSYEMNQNQINVNGIYVFLTIKCL